MAYSIVIDGVDRTGDVIAQSVVVEDVINDKQNTCSFELIDLSGSGIPSTDDEVVITLANDSKLFGGYILSVSLDKKAGAIKAKIKCIDYVRLLDRNLAHITYEDSTDKEVIEGLVGTYALGVGITTTNVLEGVTIDQIRFNYIQLSQCLRRICDLTGRNWYIDYNKDIHYFPLTTNPAPFNIDSDSDDYKDLRISKDASQLKNRVYVRGGTKLSDPTTYSSKGDGVKKQFVLPDKPKEVSITVNGTPKTLGIKNVNLTGYDWYVNFQEKYVEQDASGGTLSSSDTLVVTYSYDIPILVAIENSASIEESGQREFAIFDKSISTTQSARERASAELTDYANNIIEGSFRTYTAGFRTGQYININLSEYGVNDDYLIQRVTAHSMGGGMFYYDVSIASSKTMGIIRFLIELLEANKNLIELDDNEVIDELLTVNDALLSDSLTDAMTIDSAGPYATWCTDNETTPTTRARWNLWQW